VTEEGIKYPSVTTALSYLSRKAIYEWRKRVGDDHANRISKKASSAGTRIHAIAEKYVLNDPSWKDASPISLSTFNTIRPYLDDHVDEIYGVELQMMSRELKTAGTADLICRYKGKNTVVDFKTSARQKKESDILSYFMQCAAYAIMVKELYNMEIDSIAILMAVHDDLPVVFEKDAEQYKKIVRRYFKHYHAGELG
jgi:genome maintenance exonuclease 1